MSKAKGSRAERELFHKLWEHGFAVVRVAGSGSTTKPACDLVAGNTSRVLALECKSIKGTRKYFDREELDQLLTFAQHFGAEAWIGVRFDQKGWYFVEAHNVERSKGKSFCLSFNFLQKHGFVFEELVGTYRQQRFST